MFLAFNLLPHANHMDHAGNSGNFAHNSSLTAVDLFAFASLPSNSIGRIGARLDGLTTSLIAWKQFESGLNEFTAALGKDKGALRGLYGILDGPLAFDDAAATATETTKLALDVKEVAKRLSEHLDNNLQRKSAVQSSNGEAAAAAAHMMSTRMATQPVRK